MSAHFELYKDPKGEYRFLLKDDENQSTLCMSNGFRTKELCMKRLLRIKEDAASAPINEVSQFNFHEYCKC